MDIKFNKPEQYDVKALLRYLGMAVAVIVLWKITGGVGSLLVSLFVFML